jgi:hypothetical protein
MYLCKSNKNHLVCNQDKYCVFEGILVLLFTQSLPAPTLLNCVLKRSLGVSLYKALHILFGYNFFDMEEKK